MITTFIPKRELTAIENLNAFINFARNELTIFGKDLVWDDPVWDMSDHIEYRSHKAINVSWYNFDKKSRWDNGTLLKEEFIDFAKSFLRYTQGLKKTKNYKTTVDALKSLERSLCNAYSKPCPTLIDAFILNQSQKLLKNRFAHNYAASCSKEIEKIAKFLNDNSMLRTFPFIWKSSIKQNDLGRISGDEFTDYRNDKLPTDSCLYAIADIYNNPKQPFYKMAASIAILLLSNPCRIGEVLTLQRDCLVSNHQGFADGLGIRWFPEKGSEPFVKPVLPVWRELVLKAVADIKEMTKEAHHMAKWYEKNPESIYLPPKYEYLRNEDYLDTETLRELLSFSKRSLADFIKKYNIKQKHRFHQPALIKFSDITNIIVSLLPNNFPYRYKNNGLKYSESLFVVPYFFTNSCCDAYSKIMFQEIKYKQISSAFGGIKTNRSMFDALNFFEPDGDRIVFKTHAARHLQDTVAESAHIPQTLRAYFAGRANIKHNQAYAHTPKDVLAIKSLNINDQSDISPSNAKFSTEVYSEPEVMAGMLSRQFNDSVHITDVGFCTMGSENSCTKYMDHILCSDHLYIKGDKRLQKIPQKIEFIENLINERQKNSLSLPINLMHDKQVLEVLRCIQSILDNPDIPDESFFKIMPGKDYSPIRVKYFKRNNKVLGGNKDGSIPIIKIGELCLDT